MKIWMIGGGAVGSAFGPVPVALAEISAPEFSTYALFGLWPALALFGTGFGWGVAFLQDQFEDWFTPHDGETSSSFHSDSQISLPSDRS